MTAFSTVQLLRNIETASLVFKHFDGAVQMAGRALEALYDFRMCFMCVHFTILSGGIG
jgi:hypothetical protein